MNLAQIAKTIQQHPMREYSFRMSSWKNDQHSVVWRRPNEYRDYFMFFVEGDQWTPYLNELMAEDWEFTT